MIILEVMVLSSVTYTKTHNIYNDVGLVNKTVFHSKIRLLVVAGLEGTGACVIVLKGTDGHDRTYVVNH